MDDSKICIVRNDKLGDVLLTCPMIHAVKTLWPSSEVTVIVSELTYPVVSRLSTVDHVIIDYRQQFRVSSLTLIKKVTEALNEQSFDYIFFAHMDPLYVFGAYLAGIKNRVGDANNLILSRFISKKVPISWHDFTKHEIEQQMRLLEPFLNENVPFKHPEFIFEEKLEQEVATLLTSQAIENGYIVIHPSYGEGNRGWSAQDYAKLIDLIQTQTSHQVVITGSDSEQDIADVIMELTQTSPINLVSKTTVEQLFGLVKGCNCIIGAETGPVHMATLCKRPVISISPTKYIKPFRWGPFGTNHVVIKNNKKCDLICHTYKQNCEEDFCLNSITVNDVFSATRFITEQETFPKNQLYYWFKTSGTVAILLDDLSNEEIVETTLPSIISLLNQENIRWFLCTTKPIVKDTLSNLYSDIFFAKKTQISKWVKQFCVTDVTVIHTLSEPQSLWIESIKKFIALKIDKEPVVVNQTESFSSIRELLDYYLQTAQRLSQNKYEPSHS